MARRFRAHRTLAYVRVSTDEQCDSRAGLEAQRVAIEAEAARREWGPIEWIEDGGYSGKSLDRPGMTYALQELAEGRADVLVAAKTDRLTRSLIDFATLMDKAHRAGWTLVALDLAVDTSTPAGEAMASVMATFAQLERRMIGQRTKDALAAKRSQGVRVGRPVQTPAEIRQRVASLRAEGLSMRAIAERLNAEGAPRTRGGARWYASTVSRVLDSLRNEAELAVIRGE